MRDGKALQMGTSHELGQNFARAFEIQFLAAGGQQQLCWTTSWGADADGRRADHVPWRRRRPAGAPPARPTQVVVVLVKADGDAGTVAAQLAAELKGLGVRVELDERVDLSFGRRSVDWELKGVPVRLEVGPRDVAEGVVTVVRRDVGTKQATPLGSRRPGGLGPAGGHTGRHAGRRHRRAGRPHPRGRDGRGGGRGLERRSGA